MVIERAYITLSITFALLGYLFGWAAVGATLGAGLGRLSYCLYRFLAHSVCPNLKPTPKIVNAESASEAANVARDLHEQ
jgi:hypothetical protein